MKYIVNPQKQNLFGYCFCDKCDKCDHCTSYCHPNTGGGGGGGPVPMPY